MLKKHKNIIFISVLVLIGVLLIILSSFDCSSDEKTEDFSSIDYTRELEGKIEAFLKKVDGIKEAKVVITLDSSVQKIYTQNENNLSYILSGNGTPITVTELAPTIRGVGVACTNGDNDYVKMQITELLSCYLGISSNKIKIVPIK